MHVFYWNDIFRRAPIDTLVFVFHKFFLMLKPGRPIHVGYNKQRKYFNVGTIDYGSLSDEIKLGGIVFRHGTEINSEISW